VKTPEKIYKKKSRGRSPWSNFSGIFLTFLNFPFKILFLKIVFEFFKKFSPGNLPFFRENIFRNKISDPLKS